MVTTIDALIVTLGLDPKDFQKGAKTAAAEALKTRKTIEREAKAKEKAETDAAKAIERAQKKAANEAEAAAKRIEKAQDQTTAGIERTVRNFTRLAALFTAGRGISEFTSFITGADAAVGRLAKSIGAIPEDISAISKAVERGGGSAEAAAGTFKKLADNIQAIRFHGDGPMRQGLLELQAAGGTQIKFGQDYVGILSDIADNLKAVNEQRGPAAANFLGEQLGFDAGSIALYVQGGAALRKAMQESKALGITTKESAEAAIAYQRALAGITQVSEDLGRTIVMLLAPSVTDLGKKLQDWIRDNREVIDTKLNDFVRTLKEELGRIDWPAVAKGLGEFVTGANSAAQAVGGWKNALEILLGAWLFTKLGNLLRTLGLIRVAFISLGPVGWGLLGTGALAGALASADPRTALTHGGVPTGSLNPGDELPGVGGGSDRRPGIFARARRAVVERARRLRGGGGDQGRDIRPTSSNINPEVAAYIRAAAASRGINPDTAIGIADGEGLGGSTPNRLTPGDYQNGAPTSFGPFQMHRGGAGSVGTEYEKATGHKVDDPKYWKEQIDFSLDWAKKNGWGAWYGRSKHNIGLREGLNYTPGATQQAPGNVAATNGVGGVDQAQGGSIRRQPITEALKSQIARAATAAGVNAEIYSGGQDESGPNRTGSHRHDHGQSADLKLYTMSPDGKRRYLSMTNDADRAVMEKFIRSGVAAGANGVGAAVDYMGPNGIHIGGGTPSAWGANGSSANAPDWVRRAHEQGMRDRTAEPRAARSTAGAVLARLQTERRDPLWRGTGFGSPAGSVPDTPQRMRDSQVAQMTTNQGSTDNSRRDETHFHAPITVQTAAKDASGIARDMEAALRGRNFIMSANTGTA